MKKVVWPLIVRTEWVCVAIRLSVGRAIRARASCSTWASTRPSQVETQALGGAHEQREPQSVLERADVATDGALGDAELFGDLREAQMASRSHGAD
jgi:hypothetical protein